MTDPGLWDALAQAWPASKAKGLWEGLDYSGVGAAMPESYGANSPIMDPLAKAALGLGKSAISGVMAPGDAWAGKLDPMSDEGFRRTMDLAGLMTLGAGAAPAEANSFRAGIKAYHGSPHDFDAFSMDKIGTGEGAQAYGHGLYFAENPKVAEEYRNTLADWKVDGKAPDPTNPSHIAAVTLKSYGNPEAAITDLSKTATSTLPEGERVAASNAIDLIKSGAKLPEATGGRMYEVNINADPEHFLDWDKPLSQQHPQIQRQLEDAYPGTIEQGRSVQQSLFPYGVKPQVTDVLREAGIPGIKYLDQGSRGAGEGSRNYVVFDDKLVDIMKKYGLVGATPLATGLGLARRDNNQ